MINCPAGVEVQPLVIAAKEVLCVMAVNAEVAGESRFFFRRKFCKWLRSQQYIAIISDSSNTFILGCGFKHFVILNP